MNQKIVYFLITICSAKAGAIEYSLGGNIENKLLNYVTNTSSNTGYNSAFQFEQKAVFNNSLEGLNQVKIKATSLEEDVKVKKKLSKKDSFDTYLGENYLKYKNSNFVSVVGFQDVAWGEAYGFNYADIINPKDNRYTFYDDQAEARIPLLLLNTKYFLANGSIQLLYSPRPSFSKTLPIDLFLGSALPQNEVIVKESKSPNLFSENEFGGKFSTSYEGIDLSTFYYNYLERDPYYTVNTYSTSSITLNENHNRINSFGFSVAKTVYDFVLRSDIVLTNNKTFNYLNNYNLLNYRSNTTDVLISVDTPTYNKYTFYFILASHQQSEFVTGSFLPENQNNIILKVSKSLDNERTFDLSYTRDFKEGGNAVQALLNWPITNTTELKIGGEFYFGPEASTYSKAKKLNNIFFNIKNYFKL